MAELSAIIDVEEHMCKNILKWSEENTQETAKTMTFITLLDLYLHLEHRCTNPNDFDGL